MFHEAYEYFERGLNVIPLMPKSKRPPKGFDLKSRFSSRCSVLELREWFVEGNSKNVGIVTGSVSEVLVIDADSLDAARALYRKLPRTAMMTKTPKGAHFFYRLKEGQVLQPRVRVKVLGIQADIRAESAYVVAAPSVHPSGARYERIGRWELIDVPYFDQGWIDLAADHRQSAIKNASGYIAKIEAVAGHGGHAATFRAACKLRDAGLSPEEALAELIEWNRTGNAKPPWSTRELLHKVESAYRRNPQC